MSHAKDKNHRAPFADDSAIEAAVHRVLCATGRIVPRTDQEVVDAEAQIQEENVQLPDRLTRPPTGPPPNDDAKLQPSPDKPQSAASENLARAARCGREIPPEVLLRMQEDRLNAEREANGHG